MTPDEIVQTRLRNQRLTGAKFETPEKAVSWFGAVQAQDFPAAKWSLGLRVKNATNENLQKAYDERKILRTHIMRPTWHFVTPKNISWIEELSSDRVKSKMKTYNKSLGLNEEIFTKTKKIITEALKKNSFLTRNEIKGELEKEGIMATAQKLAHIASWAELEGEIASGPMKGKQFSYSLLPHPKLDYSKEKALTKLAKLYFQSHGPALIKDFSWWSGLTKKDAEAGIKYNKLRSQNVNGKEYYFFPEIKKLEANNPSVILLSVYDEYFIGYTDRSLILEDKYKNQMAKVGNALLTSLILIDGKVTGVWKRVIKKRSAEIKLNLFRSISQIEKGQLTGAANKYGDFFGLKTNIHW